MVPPRVLGEASFLAGEDGILIMKGNDAGGPERRLAQPARIAFGKPAVDGLGWGWGKARDSTPSPYCPPP